MKKIKVGIIGCGVIAPTHARCYQKLEGVEVAWACDLVKEKARKLAEEYKIPNITTRYQDVLRDPSVSCISVCTDHAAHVPVTVAALRSGKHVLCEKALAADPRGLERMFAESRRHPKLVFAGVFQRRFDPVLLYVKRLMDQKVFGKVLTAGTQVRCLRTNEYYRKDAWRGTWDKEGGAVLINQAIHYIDILLWLTGGVKTVCGVYDTLTHRGIIETEDTAAAAVCFRSGAIGTIEVTSSSYLKWEATFSVHGTEGSLDLRNEKPFKVSFIDPARQREVEAGLATALSAPGEVLGKDYYGRGHPAQIADFIRSIRTGRKPFIPARSARHTVDVVFALYRSHRTGRRVTLPADSRP